MYPSREGSGEIVQRIFIRYKIYFYFQHTCYNLFSSNKYIRLRLAWLYSSYLAVTHKMEHLSAPFVLIDLFVSSIMDCSLIWLRNRILWKPMGDILTRDVLTFDFWLITCDFWLITCDFWLITYDFWLITCDFWLITCDFWLITCDFRLITCDIWPVALQIRVRIEKLFSLLIMQNICCWYSKEPSQWDGSFEHPKHMFKLMGKKILTI